MPVVLTTAPGLRRSGHVYDDKTGIAYEFPAGRYERWIVEGEPFIYCEPKRGYFGAGVVGVVADSKVSGRKLAVVADFAAFDHHVGLSAPDGSYWEADPNFWKGAVYWAQGVRPISHATLERILTAAQAGSAASPLAGPAKPPRKAPGAQYTDSTTAKAVERRSVEIALADLAGRFPAQEIVEMPGNNPGFDIRVGSEADPLVFVEVKGTQSSEPVFFMSEGEREFSERHAVRYELLVVTGIDLASKDFLEVHRRQGAVGPAIAEMKPSQWRAKLTV
jgi:hypothetical protein